MKKNLIWTVLWTFFSGDFCYYKRVNTFCVNELFEYVERTSSTEYNEKIISNIMSSLIFAYLMHKGCTIN